MLTITLNNMAATIIFLWSMWCIFCPAVNDGIVGKFIYGFIALAAFALMVGNQHICNANANNALTWSLAMLGLRQVVLRYVWPKIRPLIGRGVLQRRAGD